MEVQGQDYNISRLQRGILDRSPGFVLELNRFLPYPLKRVGDRLAIRPEYAAQNSDTVTQAERFNGSQDQAEVQESYKIKSAEEQSFFRASKGVPIPYPIKIGGVWLPGGPLLRLKSGKSMQETEVAGRDGTFKELIANRDWDITITGWCFDEATAASNVASVENYGYPELAIRQLVELCSRKSALDVECKLLAWYGITRLVIKDYDFAFTGEYLDVVPFVLNCVSDRPYQLQIIDRNGN